MDELNFFTLSSKELGKKSGIYKLKNGGHIYIGSSKNLYSRLIEHRTDLIKQNHTNSFLQRVSDKEGIDKFEIEILEYCLAEERIIKEKEWIDKLKPDMNLKDPVTNELSEESKRKLGESVRNGRLNGKYKTKFDLCEVEQYDYFGNFVCKFQDKTEASEKLNLSKKEIQELACGYKKGKNKNGIRLRYSDSNVPVQNFEMNPQYVGKYYDFYFVDENGNEQIAFTNLKDCWKFFGQNAFQKEIRIIPKLKSRESGDVLEQDNPNPSITEM